MSLDRAAMQWMGVLFLGLGLLGCEPESPGTVSVGEPDDDSQPTDTYRPMPNLGVGGRNESGAPTGSPEDSGEPCEDDSDCSASSTCFQGTCVGDGALRFSLSWEADTDYDLHVLTPDDIEISFANPSAGGGLLDVDDCVGGDCRDPGGTHVENIFFPDAPVNGVYTYWAHNWAGEIVARFELEVSEDTRVVESDSGSLPIRSPAESTHFTFEY